MIRIIVCRNAAAPEGCPLDDPNLIWGPDISDALLNTVQAAQARGRVEIDRGYSNRRSIKLSMHGTAYNPPGSLQSILDPGNLSVEVGKVKRFSIEVSKTSRETLNVQKSIELEALGE
jgi:hypothetical protein